MKKKILMIVLLLTMFSGGYALATTVNGTFEGNPIVKLFNGDNEITAGDVPAIIYKNRTMVPISLLNRLGVKTVWDPAAYSVNVELPKYLTQDELNTIAESVLEVHGYTSDPTIYEQGSGVVINGVLVTNYHVGGGAAYVDVFIDGKAVRLTDIVFKDQSKDLMAFKIEGQKSVDYSTELTKADDTIYAIGFPKGKFKVTQGKIYNPDFSYLGKSSIVHTATIDAGSSGGALLNSKGEVIGIMKSNSGRISNAIPIQYFKDDINKQQ